MSKKKRAKPLPAPDLTQWNVELIDGGPDKHWTVGVGHPPRELYVLRDGRVLLVSLPGEEVHAVYPKATEQHPDGVPLRSVRLEPMTAAEHETLRRSLPAPSTAIPRFHWRGPVGAGGHERTDGAAPETQP